MRLFLLTGACGAGKSTLCAALQARLDPAVFACIDTDSVGLNWHDYAGTDHEPRYSEDCLQEALRLAGDRHLIFATCLNPRDFFACAPLPERVEATTFLLLCPEEECIVSRLQARPPERGFTSEAAIRPHADYSRWLREHRGQFSLWIDNTHLSVAETAQRLEESILRQAQP